MKLDQWQLILSARIDRFSVHFFDQGFSAPPAVPGVVTSTNVKNRVDTLPSWHGALIYKPAENGTVYFTYGTSFNPSAETLDIISSFSSFSLNNENIGPERSRTMELGTKWSLLEGGLTANASLFETDKINVRIPILSCPPSTFWAATSGCRASNSPSRARSPTAGMSRWAMTISAAAPPRPRPAARWRDTRWCSRRTTTSNSGPPTSSCRNFEVGGGGEYVGSRYAQTSVPVEQAPGYVTFDAMAKYTITDQLDAQVNVYNIVDTTYYDMMHFAFVVPGAGRSAMLTLNYHS